ncbi:MAG TPA: MBL fold metallo-hydrolase [Conexibacter sp.]|nr:MBL fold metallo-hydrolase [Conexibacter sp.]
MEQIAEGLHLLRGTPRHAVNVYLADGHVVDAGTRWAARRIVRQVRDRELAGHLVTHAHADHQGASAALARTLGLPVLAGHRDADAIASGELRDRAPLNPATRLQLRTWAGPAVPVARRLREGDRVGSFEVLETPGHSPGLISLWRASDRTLLAADVMFGQHPLTGRPGLHEPPAIFTLDPALNRAQIRRLAELRPAVVAFGHGPPWRDPEALERFAASLPS